MGKPGWWGQSEMDTHLYINPHPIFLVPQVYPPILSSRPDCVYVHISLPEMNSLYFFTWQTSTYLSGPLNIISTEQCSLTPQTRLCTPTIHSHSATCFSLIMPPTINGTIVYLRAGPLTRLEAPRGQRPWLPWGVLWTVLPRGRCSTNIYWILLKWMIWSLSCH